MTFRPLLAAAAALLASVFPALAADPVVSNLTASQRAGTKLVDITYDVTADTPTVKLTLEIHKTDQDAGANSTRLEDYTATHADYLNNPSPSNPPDQD
jgi:hypothetical protein